MDLKKTKEGRIKLFFPKGRIYDTPVFYNPEAELIRDISVSTIQTFQKEFKEKITICDALSGTGVSGLRYAKEISNVKKVVLNDKNPVAVDLIKKNLKLNGLGKKCEVVRSDANVLLRQNVFPVIDLDPFGSPNVFMDSAGRSIYHKGFLCVTATDQAPLSGTYPETCLRKYGIKSIKTEFYNELGIRILISFIILSLSRYDRAFIPLISFSKKHYFRVFGKIEHAGKISDLLKNFGYVNYCNACGERRIGEFEKFDEKNHVFENCGLIFLGEINNKKFCRKVLKEVKKRKFKLENKEEKLLNFLIEEFNMKPFYYDLHHLAEIYKIKIPKSESLIEKLKLKGFKASRTHFCLTGIKTNANLKELKSILQ